MSSRPSADIRSAAWNRRDSGVSVTPAVYEGSLVPSRTGTSGEDLVGHRPAGDVHSVIHSC